MYYLRGRGTSQGIVIHVAFFPKPNDGYVKSIIMFTWLALTSLKSKIAKRKTAAHDIIIDNTMMEKAKSVLETILK